MAIVINGSGTVTGLAVGGLPDGTVDAGTLATNSVDSAELIDGAVDNSHMAAMAASKLTGALPAISGASLTGVVPIVAGTVLQRVSTQAATYSGTVVNWEASPSHISETTAYNSAALTPLSTLSITAKQANSIFVVELVGKFNVNTGKRSQIALQDTYTAGSQTTANNLYYSHYGLYNNTGGDLYNPGAYRVDDPRALALGATRTYYWFGGSIGSGTQQYWNLNMSITEVAT